MGQRTSKFRSLGKLVMALDANREVTKEEIRSAFEPVIGANKNIRAIESVVVSELGFHPPSIALLRLIELWNSIDDSEKVVFHV
jgi:hypothetical protein